MPYQPDLEPPAPSESVSLFGCDDGLRRLGTIGAYFGFCALTTRSCSGCSLVQLIMLHAWWWLCACYLAREINGLVCELLDEDAQRAYALARFKRMQAQPVTGLRLNPVTEQYDFERAPLPATQPRPLIDPEMGVRARN